MALHKWLALVFVWFASLTAVAVLAQGRQVPPVPPTGPVTPMVISGPDLGFRLDGRNGNAAVGKLVVRINGEWVDTEPGVGVKRVSAP